MRRSECQTVLVCGTGSGYNEALFWMDRVDVVPPSD